MTAGKTGTGRLGPAGRGAQPQRLLSTGAVPESGLTASLGKWSPELDAFCLQKAEMAWGFPPSWGRATGFMTFRGLLEAPSRGKVWLPGHSGEVRWQSQQRGLSRAEVRAAALSRGAHRPSGWMSSTAGSEMGMRPRRGRFLGNVLLAFQGGPPPFCLCESPHVCM